MIIGIDSLAAKAAGDVDPLVPILAVCGEVDGVVSDVVSRPGDIRMENVGRIGREAGISSFWSYRRLISLGILFPRNSRLKLVAVECLWYVRSDESPPYS